MFRHRPGWKPVPYSDDEKEFMADNAREMREEADDAFAQEEREKVAEWRGSNGRMISLHVEDDKSIYWKINGQKFGAAQVSGLRRATIAEKSKNPELYAILAGAEIDYSGFNKGFAANLGLTKERYLSLREKLV